MMNIQPAYHALKTQLEALYDAAEAANIADWVLESLTGYRLTERVRHGNDALTTEQEALLERYTAQLLVHRPVQYVLGESYFYGLKLAVDESVLIPRPETEELVDWTLKSTEAQAACTLLDIGTGSGCIPLALKKNRPQAQVYAVDISEDALAVARRNALNLALDVDFRLMNILDPAQGDALPLFDVIVSNPPYITTTEKESMMPHVLDYEPHLALFVSNNDPLQFYKAIEHFARKKMKPGGLLFLELHRDFAVETGQYYRDKGWHTVLRKDMQDNDRMLCCTLL